MRNHVSLYVVILASALVLGIFVHTWKAGVPANDVVDTEVMETGELETSTVTQTDTPVSIQTQKIVDVPTPSFTDGQLYDVVKVVDGDTIVISKDGVDATVRMIGVDTPETVHPSKPVQCFGAEASKKTKEWLEGESVYLKVDPTQGERDKYGRLLGYVFRDDGLFINRSLISEGFAFEYTYNLPYEYQAEFQAAEDTARLEKRGLWADEACGGLSEGNNSSAMSLPAANPNDKDCSDFNYQAEAQAYFEAGGGSPTYNFDRLDSDHDGVACESLP